jgi:hypothetical protein
MVAPRPLRTQRSDSWEGVPRPATASFSAHAAPTSSDRLRARRLLDGYRGRPPGDRDALADVVKRVSALVEIVPELRELDLNPVKVLEPGKGAVVVDGRMRVGP